jgi:hypothetical protein
MTLRSKHIVAIVVVVFVAGIGTTMVLNLWQTTSSKVPATYTSGEFAGEFNPADIRGSYSFGDIEEAFAVPVSALAEAFAVADTENPSAFLCKSLEDLYGELENGEVGTDSVRWFVALYTGLPYTPEEDTLMPAASIAVLEGRADAGQLDALRTKSVELTAATRDAAPSDAGVEAITETDSAPESSDTHTETEAGEVKGKTTFGELASWGVSDETIESILGLPPGKAGVTVRDYCVDNDIEFSTVKDALQEAAQRALSGR